MKAIDIIAHINRYLPALSNAFSDELPITSLTRAGSTVTAITATPHGFTSGVSLVNIVDALTPYSIVSLTRVGNIATAILATPHDLTEGFTKDVEVVGADQAEYNGTHKLLEVINRRSFTFEVIGAPVTPATGTMFFLQKRTSGYNGRFLVTVIDPVTFTYAIATTPLSPARGTILVRFNIRVGRTASLERGIAAYTKQEPNKLLAWVVLEPTVANKDRHMGTDLIGMARTSNFLHQILLKSFSVYVLAPIAKGDEIAQLGGKERDDMEDIEVLLYRVLVNASVVSGFIDPSFSNIMALGNAFEGYVPPYYIHRFSFEVGTSITSCDVFEPDESIALREIHLDFERDFVTSDPVIMTGDIKFDEVD